MRISFAAACICAMFLMPIGAAAQTVEEARQLYIDGDYAAALEILEPMAEAGNPMAQNILGDAYWDGNGKPVDLNKALEWLEKSADQGYGRALHNLGFFWRRDRDGFSADVDKAIDYFDRAIAAGHIPSMSEAGYTIENFTDNPDHDRARAYYERGVTAGDGLAMTNLGTLFHYGRGSTLVDYEKARELFQGALDQEVLGGAAGLAFLYARGQGVEQDFTIAAGFIDEYVRIRANTGQSGGYAFVGDDLAASEEYPSDKILARLAYEEGVRRGETASLLGLGVIYETGNGVEQDIDRARQLYAQAGEAGESNGWFYLGLTYDADFEKDYLAARLAYERGATQDNSGALINLGHLSYMGLGGPQDFAKGLEYTLAAINVAEDHIAYSNAGEYFFYGLGTARDDARALEMFQKAYDLDSVIAAYFLGEHYREGRAVLQDFDRALAYFSEAAQWGDEQGLFALGRAYALGEGVPANLPAARALYLQAAEAGSYRAARALASLASSDRPGIWQDDEAAYRYCLISVMLDPRPLSPASPQDCQGYGEKLPAERAAQILTQETE